MKSKRVAKSFFCLIFTLLGVIPNSLGAKVNSALPCTLNLESLKDRGFSPESIRNSYHQVQQQLEVSIFKLEESALRPRSIQQDADAKLALIHLQRIKKFLKTLTDPANPNVVPVTFGADLAGLRLSHSLSWNDSENLLDAYIQTVAVRRNETCQEIFREYQELISLRERSAKRTDEKPYHDTIYNFIPGALFEISTSIKHLRNPGLAGDFLDSFSILLADYLERSLLLEPSSRLIFEGREISLIHYLEKKILFELRPESDQLGRCTSAPHKVMWNEGRKWEWLLNELRFSSRQTNKQYENILTKIRTVSAFGTIAREVGDSKSPQNIALLARILGKPSEFVQDRYYYHRIKIRHTDFDDPMTRARSERPIQFSVADRPMTTAGYLQLDASNYGLGFGKIFHHDSFREWKIHLKTSSENLDRVGAEDLIQFDIPTLILDSMNHVYAYGLNEQGKFHVILLDEMMGVLKSVGIAFPEPGQSKVLPKDQALSPIINLLIRKSVYAPVPVDVAGIVEAFDHQIALQGRQGVTRCGQPIEDPFRPGLISKYGMETIPDSFKVYGVDYILKRNRVAHGSGINRWQLQGSYPRQCWDLDFPTGGAHSGGVSDIFLALELLGKKSIFGSADEAYSVGLLVSEFMNFGGYHSFAETFPIVQAVAKDEPFQVNLGPNQKDLYLEMVGHLERYSCPSVVRYARKYLAAYYQAFCELRGRSRSFCASE